MNKEYKTVTKEIDKTLPEIKEKKTYRDYIIAIEEVDILLDRLDEKNKEVVIWAVGEREDMKVYLELIKRLESRLK